MFEKFLIQVVPSAKEIINFKPEVGRGKVFWVYFSNNFGKCSTFLKKKVSEWLQKVYSEFKKYNWLNLTNVESPSGRVYEVTQTYCTCPDYRHNIIKGKTWRTFCKHQLMQYVNQFSKEINNKYQQRDQLRERLDKLKTETFFFEHYKHYGLSYREDTVRLGDAKFSISVDGSDIGVILVDNYFKTSKVQRTSKQPTVETFAEARQRTLIKEFDDSIDALNYLLKGVELVSIEEQQARNSLFWEEPNADYHQTYYSESEREADMNEIEYPMQTYFEEEKAEESKPQKKKWISLEDIQDLPF